MWEYILCAGICAVIWIINGRCIIRSAREHITGEIYSHTGLGIFFTLLTLELILATLECGCKPIFRGYKLSATFYIFRLPFWFSAR